MNTLPLHLPHRRSASLRAGGAALAFLAAAGGTLAAMFSPPPPPPPPDFDATSALIAAVVEGHTVLAQVADSGVSVKMTGGRESIAPGKEPARPAAACSQFPNVSSPTDRSQCEAYSRLELQKRSSLQFANQQYNSSMLSSRLYFERSDDQNGIFNTYVADRSQRIKVSTTDALLTRVRLLGVTKDGSAVISAESVGERDGMLRWNNKIKLYDAKGLPVPGAELNVNDPRMAYGDYVVANELGEIGLIRRDGDALELEWRPLAAAQANGKRAMMNRAMNPPTRLAVDGAENAAAEFNFEEFTRISTRLDGGDASHNNQPITHAEVVALVHAYAGATWTLAKDNFGMTGAPPVCRPQQGQPWQRPARYETQMGRTIKGVPYKWGGYVSIEQFGRQIGRPVLAGNTCACSDPKLNYCVLDKAVGIDATGFLSRVWKVDRQTTASIDGITDHVAWKDLRTGDALVKKNEHVRVFLEFMHDKAADIGFRIAESSVSCGGVCERILTARELDGYEPRRYKLIRE